MSAPLECTDSALFFKREPLDSFKKKWRMQRFTAKCGFHGHLATHSMSI
ncbi:hypothetical protein QU617_12865 [Pseudomonas guariconensis]|nr:hypothetical protein [Pseudomonas guariconensis]MDM9607033.1 hypothetical protein [Pseudomonas guariconensis]MDM9611989.1 hypothetical protein [Pseudomonas guariconensis]